MRGRVAPVQVTNEPPREAAAGAIAKHDRSDSAHVSLQIPGVDQYPDVPEVVQLPGTVREIGVLKPIGQNAAISRDAVQCRDRGPDV